jgi:hypothetical protein
LSPERAPDRRQFGTFLTFRLTNYLRLALTLSAIRAHQEKSVLPELPDKLIWALAVVATMAVMATRGHADIAPVAAVRGHVSQQLTASTTTLHGRYW